MGNALAAGLAVVGGIALGYYVVTKKLWVFNTTSPGAPPATATANSTAPASALPLNSDYQTVGTSMVLPAAPFFQAPGGAGGAMYPAWRGF